VAWAAKADGICGQLKLGLLLKHPDIKRSNIMCLEGVKTCCSLMQTTHDKPTQEKDVVIIPMY